MKNTCITFFFVLLSTFAFAEGDTGIKFFEGTWAEALKAASDQDKLIFVDAYTSWCGPCKRMARDVFTREDVGDFYNKTFINVKLDMEKGEGRNFRQKYAVSAFPTLLYVDSEGTVQHKSLGGKQPEQFIQLGKTALSKVDYSGKFEEKYEEGERSPKFLHDYAIALQKSKKPSLKVANEYLRTQDDLSTEKNLKFLSKLATEADSRIFGLMTKNKKGVIALVGEEKYLAQVDKACSNTIKKAIEFESLDLLEEAKTKFAQENPAKANEFATNADIVYNLEMGNAEQFVKITDKYLKKAPSDIKAKEYNRMAVAGLYAFGEDSGTLKSIEKWAKKAMELGKNPEGYETYLNTLLKLNKKAEAIKVAEQAVELFKDNPVKARTFSMMLQRAKG